MPWVNFNVILEKLAIEVPMEKPTWEEQLKTILTMKPVPVPSIEKEQVADTIKNTKLSLE